jgi:hypothetical protein
MRSSGSALPLASFLTSLIMRVEEIKLFRMRLKQPSMSDFRRS